MPSPEKLLERLHAIGASLAATNEALALIGLGSVGIERQRLDAHSDLDFFAIVKPGAKARFIDDLGWLSRIAPVVYAFRNTVDGFKLLYGDDVFCEFAVFEPQELAEIPFAEGAIIWKAPGVDDAIRRPVRPTPAPATHATEWMVGEALTCLYVGLNRYHRGEKLSAQRFIQHYAVDRVLELTAQAGGATAVPADPFSVERRFEARFPAVAALLPRFVQGYDRSLESALAILVHLERTTAVNPAMAARIRELASI
jgi:hypothetical protein